jgi:nitrogen fixation/metabolism regulation signal transduction histidine kinase
MKPLRTGLKDSLINVRILSLIYLLLCLITILFSRNFFLNALSEGARENGGVLSGLQAIVFFTIPAVLLLFFGVSIWTLFRGALARRPGSKFRTRLLAYFAITVFLAASPVTIVTIQAFYEITYFWRQIKVRTALEDARNFVLDNYNLKLERFNTIHQNTNFDDLMRRVYAGAVSSRGEITGASRDIAAIQDFEPLPDGTWNSRVFLGVEGLNIQNPPVNQQGLIAREMPRDRDVVRYVENRQQNLIRIVTYDLGRGFDDSRELIDAETVHFEIIDSILGNIRQLLLFYYGVFFLPSLLMTLIISISFTRDITEPIVELSEATRRVAEGDFSIQIMSHQKDELGSLIGQFNAMVRELEKTRNALVQTEKISIWQTMAQQLAHEIKNPLTPIKLSAERVLRRWQNDREKTGEILENSMFAIIQEVESLSALLNEFRTLSRPIEPSNAVVPLGAAIEEIITPYKSSHPLIQFDTSHVSNSVRVKIEKRHFSQVLTNLIINAIDAMDGNGRIEIRTDVITKVEQRYCRISVKDSGKGIKSEEAGRIFTPYFTTKDSGTGLGLPIVERIVRDYGGAVLFNSAPGLGATFLVDLKL